LVTPDASGQTARPAEHLAVFRDDDAGMDSMIDLRSYDGKVVFVELLDGSELAGPAALVGDKLDVFGRMVAAAEVVSIEAL
jgi:hypothetical protein